MRFVSITAATAALAIPFMFAPTPGRADDIMPRREEKQSHEPRRWGVKDLIPRVHRGGPKDGVLPGAVVEYNTATRKISVIRPIDVKKGLPVAGASSPREAAETFLKTNHAALGLAADLSDLRLEKELVIGDSTGFTYTQIFRGLPVVGSQVYVVARKDAVRLASAEIIPVVIDGRFAIPSDAAPAIRAVVQDVGRRFPAEVRPGSEPTARLLILVRGGFPVPVWEVDYMTTDDSYRALVDATTNEVLSAATTMAFF